MMMKSQCLSKIIPLLCKRDLNLFRKQFYLLDYCRLRFYSVYIKNSSTGDPSNTLGNTNIPISPNRVDSKGNKPVEDLVSDDDEDPGFKAVLSAVTPNVPPPSCVDIVPGKGPPPEPPVTCCMSGCANCVWIQYAEELKNYFSAEEGSLRAKEAIETIENPGLQMFLKLELGLL